MYICYNQLLYYQNIHIKCNITINHEDKFNYNLTRAVPCHDDKFSCILFRYYFTMSQITGHKHVNIVKCLKITHVFK